MGAGLVFISFCFFLLNFPFSPSRVYFSFIAQPFQTAFSRVTSMKKPPAPRKSHARGWNTRGLETITMTCGISNVERKSSRFSSPRRSLKCPNVSNHVSFRSSQPFSWKAIAYLMNFFGCSSKPFLATTSSLLPGPMHCMSALPFCTHRSLHIHRTALK